MADRTKLSWTPQRRGETYCSPACGRGCTKTEYDAATKSAADLVARLGPGWKPRVFENLGWHSGVISPCGRIKVHTPSVDGSYTAFLGPADLSGGYWTGDAETPELAIANAIKAGKRELERVRVLLEGL
jgi:hypothetical protein